MLRELEKGVLTRINFVDRYINARNGLNKNRQANYKLTSKDVIDSLKQTSLNFKKASGQYIADIERTEYIFRLLFDIKGDSILTYIYILQSDKFVDNGLSHFGYLLNYFDIE